MLKADKKKVLYDGITIPSNAKDLRPPKLNTAVYIRLGEHYRSKEKGAQERQNGMNKAAIPLFYSMSEIERTQDCLDRTTRYKKMVDQTTSLDEIDEVHIGQSSSCVKGN